MIFLESYENGNKKYSSTNFSFSNIFISLVSCRTLIWYAFPFTQSIRSCSSICRWFQEALCGYLLAISIGVTSAAIMSQSKILERSFYPYAILLQTLPAVAVAPLIVLWFGFDMLSVVIICLIISLFPIINNTLLGLKSTSINLVELFQMHNKSRFVSFFKLRLPAAIPHTIAGLRISAGLSVVGAIVGEFIIGSGTMGGGLGVMIIYSQGDLETALVMALIFTATFLGFMFFSTVSLLGYYLLRHWHESEIA